MKAVLPVLLLAACASAGPVAAPASDVTSAEVREADARTYIEVAVTGTDVAADSLRTGLAEALAEDPTLAIGPIPPARRGYRLAGSVELVKVKPACDRSSTSVCSTGDRPDAR